MKILTAWKILSRAIPLIGWCSLVLALPLYAAEPAQVDVSPPPPGTIWVGQRVPVSVNLLALGQFSGSPQFDLPTIPGAIFMQVSDSPLLLTREIEGESYTVQQYDFALFVQRGGPCVVPSFQVRFSTKARYDAPEVTHRLHTKAMTLDVKVPPGAPAQGPVISTTALEIKEDWSPQLGPAKVGDAFTRRITMRAGQVPSMLLPVLGQERIAGLARYPKPPLLQDRTERGEFTGERVDRVTYVCETPGTFDIPAVTVRWWDAENNAWSEARLPAAQLKVAANPKLSAQTSTNATGDTDAWSGQGRLWLGMGVVIIGILVLLGPRLKRAWHAWHLTRSDSEPGRFARLMKACRSGDAAATDQALTLWCDGLGLRRTDLATEIRQDTDLARALDCLQESLIDRHETWSGTALASHLRTWRRQYLHRNHHGLATKRLPGLNPSAEYTAGKRQAS